MMAKCPSEGQSTLVSLFPTNTPETDPAYTDSEFAERELTAKLPAVMLPAAKPVGLQFTRLAVSHNDFVLSNRVPGGHVCMVTLADGVFV